MRGRSSTSGSGPPRTSPGSVLAAAIDTVRDRLGRALEAGTCLAVIAAHFIETWKDFPRGSLTRSRKVRDRDEGFCQVPGCSHRAVHAHHVLFRSHGGSDDAENQIGSCALHHLRCIHGGQLAVFGQAPDGLTWLLGGHEWTGPGSATCPTRAAPSLH